MKKTITILSLLAVLSVKAQTITYANFSTALTSTLTAVIADNTSFNIALTTTTGTGVTWNATGLTQQTGTPTVNFIYGNPSGTPYASTFSNSNYAQYDPALVSVMSYDYLIFNSDSISKVGEYTASSGAHEVYQNGDKHLIFPFSYGSSFTDTYAKTNYSNATTVSSNQTGMRTVNFNGFGTLNLPQATFTNVAFISELRTNSLGPDSHDYTWYDISNGKKLMLYSENAGTTTVAYSTDLNSGITENKKAIEYSISPNPFSSQTSIKLNIEQKNSVIIITDILGKVVKSILVNSNEITIDRGKMENGIYFYSIINENGAVVNGKLIIN